MKKLLVLVVTILLLLSGCGPSLGAYGTVDRAQATDAHYKEVAEYMDSYFEEQGLFVVNFSVEWIGYYKYSELYSEEEYEDMQIGGYYSYQANLSAGEYVSGRISTYWGENESPVIVDLSYENAAGKTVLVEYSDEKISQCWQTYYDKVHA